MQTRDQGPTLDYITRTFVKEPEWIAAARAKGEELRPGMQISPYEGHLLQWIVRMAGAANILEIGTFMGTSTMWIAGGMAEGGKLTALEFSTEYTPIARVHCDASPHKENITIVHTDAHAWLAQSAAEPTYDLVFIDAEKSGYAEYLESALPRLNPGGYIVGDNTLLFGALAGEETTNRVSEAARKSMQQFNATLADQSRFESVLLPTPEGLTVARLK